MCSRRTVCYGLRELPEHRDDTGCGHLCTGDGKTSHHLECCSWIHVVVAQSDLDFGNLTSGAAR
jgi:hypothetical protein